MKLTAKGHELLAHAERMTPQAVIASVRPGFCITRAPGYMLVTDIRNGTLATG